MEEKKLRKAKNFIILVFTFFSLFLLGANQSSAAKKVVTVTSKYKSAAGITVATHLSTTTFSYDGSKLFSPKAVDTDYWTAPLNGVSSSSSKWDWYNTSSGRSNSLVKFYFGIPTPWGAVGSNYSSRIYTEVFSNGSFKY